MTDGERQSRHVRCRSTSALRPNRQTPTGSCNATDTPPARFVHDHDGSKVSWLAGHYLGPPSQNQPIPVVFMVVGSPLTVAGAATAWSVAGRTVFPCSALAGTTVHDFGIGFMPESMRWDPLSRTKVTGYRKKSAGLSAGGSGCNRALGESIHQAPPPQKLNRSNRSLIAGLLVGT
jgi:hypothetical protein